MCQCANVSMCQCVNVSMCQCVNVAASVTCHFCQCPHTLSFLLPTALLPSAACLAQFWGAPSKRRQLHATTKLLNYGTTEPVVAAAATWNHSPPPNPLLRSLRSLRSFRSLRSRSCKNSTVATGCGWRWCEKFKRKRIAARCCLRAGVGSCGAGNCGG